MRGRVPLKERTDILRRYADSGVGHRDTQFTVGSSWAWYSTLNAICPWEVNFAGISHQIDDYLTDSPASRSRGAEGRREFITRPRPLAVVRVPFILAILSIAAP